MKQSKVWKQFLVAAVASALASVFIVAVGPGFSAPNDEAAEQAINATAEEEVVEEETTEVTTTENEAYVPDPDTEPGGGDDIPENASTKADSHGHVGSGTGTSTGSQADPGHKEEGDPGYKAEDGASNGPGTGDQDAEECPNDKSSVNGDVDNGTPNGANYSGPYDSTCDGTNSENGQGSAAPGKGTPCAGCVGNADDKQPKGQVDEFTGAKANDMGYECDGNQGIGAHYGRGNPAHTGDCQPAGPVCPSDSEVNGGMPIPDGETEESYCNEDDEPETCPENSEVNAGEPIPDGMTAEEFCNEDEEPETFSAYVCVPAGNSGNFRIDEATSAEELAELLADGAFLLPANDVCMTSGGGGETPFSAYVCVPNGNSGNFRIDEATSAEELAELLADGAFLLPANGVCTTSSSGGETPFSAYLCVPNGNSGTFRIDEVKSQAELADALANGAFPLPTTGCGDRVSGGGNPPPVLVYYCPPGSPMAGQPAPGGDISKCYITLPPVCPSDSDMPGAVIPGGNVNNCYHTPPAVCPDDSAIPGMPIPGDDVNNCYYTPPPVCPEGSDMPGQPVPGGNVNNCYRDKVKGKKYCPPGTDMAGQPIPPGGIAACDTEVLDERITDDGDIDADKGDDVGAGGEGRGRKPLGGVLPFTGTSILAYVLVALQMIGAGLLIARGRKAKK